MKLARGQPGRYRASNGQVTESTSGSLLLEGLLDPQGTCHRIVRCRVQFQIVDSVRVHQVVERDSTSGPSIAPFALPPLGDLAWQSQADEQDRGIAQRLDRRPEHATIMDDIVDDNVDRLGAGQLGRRLFRRCRRTSPGE